tara:strand:- start:1119 stop:1496 length:378 start_codon:yes stop_codon:yes gene_type:complete
MSKQLAPQEAAAADVVVAEDDKENFIMGKHNGEFCFQSDCTYICTGVDGNEFERIFLGGKYYWIEQVTHYPDDYSDLKFSDDDSTLYQVKLNDIGFILGKPLTIHSKEIIPEQENTETKNVSNKP